MKIHNILLICCCLLIGLQVKADEPKKNNKAQKQVIIGIEQIDKQASELLANRFSSTKIGAEELAIVEFNEYNELLSNEDILFPADELYNSNWDTLNVNPFVRSTIEFPDSYTINCSSFSMPIDNEEIKITSKYGPRRRRMHRGTDLKVQIGDTIRASFDGKVRIKSFERRGYGHYLVLRHPNGLETVYGHLSAFLVNENQIVRAGEAIALGGNTGRSTGSHLHFETRFLGKDINPEEIIDFKNGTPHKDEYVFHNIKINGKKSNIYSTSADAIAVHRIRKGETLGHVAAKYGTTVAELCKLNGISKTSTLSIGQPIRFRSKQVSVEATPNAIKQTASDKNAEPGSDKKNQTLSKSGASDKKIEVPIENTSSSGDHLYHRIEKGDSLYSLAKKYGTTVEKLCELNNLQDNIILKIGQKIRCS